MLDSDFDSVIPTAILTAYPKVLTDIPYAKEVFNELSEDIISENLIVDKLAPEIEARYKLINRLLVGSKANQMLELATGYSTRGINFSENNKNISYVEMDLPKVCTKKINILKSFIDIPENLHIISGNALNETDFNKCERFFNKKSPVAVINEGFLRYLSFDEKRKVAINIHKLLSKYGGVWITCDVTPKKFVANQDTNLSNFNDDLRKISDRNNTNWRFENINHVRDFFGEIGFELVSVHPFSEIKEELTSPNKLNLDSKEVNRLLKDAIVAVMRPKNS